MRGACTFKCASQRLFYQLQSRSKRDRYGGARNFAVYARAKDVRSTGGPRYEKGVRTERDRGWCACDGADWEGKATTFSRRSRKNAKR